jgi:hypothetical protein
VLIWHIDKNKTDANAIESNTVNDDSSRLGVSLEQADGVNDLLVKRNRGDSGDPFPGSSDNNTFTTLMI